MIGVNLDDLHTVGGRVLPDDFQLVLGRVLLVFSRHANVLGRARTGKRRWGYVGSLHSCHQSRCGTQGHNSAQTEGSQLNSGLKGVFSLTGKAKKYKLRSCGGSAAAFRLLRQSVGGPLAPESLGVYARADEGGGVPASDPVSGPNGRLLKAWRRTYVRRTYPKIGWPQHISRKSQQLTIIMGL